VDYSGAVTTGLLWGVRYAKDNRLLPSGFDKGSASWEVAVVGAALDDDDFVGGGDVTRYRVSVGDARGPFTVHAELWYQPIGYRWAQNLGEFDTAESAQFLTFFQGVAPSSAALMATAVGTVSQ
jgi:hypothetical protein